MNEIEILDQLFNIYDRYWFIVQWWVSVSFALLVLAYFAVERIGIVLLSTVLLLYGFFTAWVFSYLLYNIDMGTSFVVDLGNLHSSGNLETEGAKTALESPFLVYGSFLDVIALPATFVGVVSYLVYAYIHAKARKST